MHYLTTIQKATCHQICPWKRYLRHHAGGTGYQRIKLTLRDVLEESLKAALALRNGGVSVESVQRSVTADYMRACATRGLLLSPTENAYDVALEQTALLRAILYGYEHIRKEIGGEVVEVGDQHFYDVHPALTLALPYDAILERGGERHLLRVKVVSSHDREHTFADLHSMEAILAPRLLNCSAIVWLYVVIGTRKEDRVGKKVQYSPWVRGYTNGMRIHWARDYVNSDGKRVRLGDTWKPFKTWIPTPECADAASWVDFLAKDGVLKDLFKIVTTNAATDAEFERLQKEIVSQEVTSEQAAEYGGEGTEYVEGFFPMHRNACDFPRPCEFQEICYGDAAADPIGSLIYQPRTPTKAEELWQQKQATEQSK